MIQDGAVIQDGHSPFLPNNLLEQELAGEGWNSGKVQDGRMVMATWIVTLASPLGGVAKEGITLPQRRISLGGEFVTLT